jgi:predicted adenine nucleotide alpha hydrolase (AANH) superfamily ATPase
MKLLLHTCCAPCSVACIKALREEGIEPTLFWYNPNIHPYAEYQKRRDTLINYAKTINASFIIEDDYALRGFICGLADKKLNNACFASPQRCAFCYKLRLEKTARTAREQGFDAFSTTLLISPYQNHDLLKETAIAESTTPKVTFLYRDFRPLFRAGQAEARRLLLYRQKYCGCIFSEEEALSTRK